MCVCVFIQVMHPYIGHHRPLRLDENKVKEQTVSITKLDVALNNAIVRAKIFGCTLIFTSFNFDLSLFRSPS